MKQPEKKSRPTAKVAVPAEVIEFSSKEVVTKETSWNLLKKSEGSLIIIENLEDTTTKLQAVADKYSKRLAVLSKKKSLNDAEFAEVDNCRLDLKRNRLIIKNIEDKNNSLILKVKRRETEKHTTLMNIVKVEEDKAAAILEAEKTRREEAEAAAAEALQNEIDSIKTDMLSKVAAATFNDMETVFDSITAEMDLHYDNPKFEKVEVKLDFAFSSINDKIEDKRTELTTAEENRVRAINDKIEEIEAAVNKIVLNMTFANMGVEVPKAMAVMDQQFNFQEFEQKFNKKRGELILVINKARQTLDDGEQDRLELLELRRNKVLTGKGFLIAENGSASLPGVDDLVYEKSHIISDNDEVFESTITNFFNRLAPQVEGDAIAASPTENDFETPVAETPMSNFEDENADGLPSRFGWRTCVSDETARDQKTFDHAVTTAGAIIDTANAAIFFEVSTIGELKQRIADMRDDLPLTCGHQSPVILYEIKEGKNLLSIDVR